MSTPASYLLLLSSIPAAALLDPAAAVLPKQPLAAKPQYSVWLLSTHTLINTYIFSYTLIVSQNADKFIWRNFGGKGVKVIV